ncbi:MAG: ATP-binding protein [Thermoplasmata archaeon]|nr:ATP-binding protein [Thermoplasmata archaeon]
MAVKLSRIGAHNPWWKDGGWRKIDPDLGKVEYLLERKKIDIPKGKVIIIRGIRRSGKTVYLKTLIDDIVTQHNISRQNIIYISCDRFTTGEVKNIVNDLLIKRGGGCLLLDEVTNLKDWYYLLKELAEQSEFTIIATGSNPVDIKAMTERLPGRGIEGNEYYFTPLSFREYVKVMIEHRSKIRDNHLQKVVNTIKKVDTQFSPLNPSVDDIYPYYDEFERLFYGYILTGGFPNAILDYMKEGKVSEETYETIIRLLLGTLAKGGRSEDTARRILEKLVSIGSGRTDFVSIANDTNLHHRTAKEYIEILESSRILYLLYAWDLEKNTHSIKKQKKIVFQSPLIPMSLPLYLWGGKWDNVLDYVEKNMEGLVENVIASHLIWTEEKPVMRDQRSFAGYYYDKKECDFLMLKDGEFHGFESHYGKLKKAKYPFKTMYLTKDTMDEDAIPTSLFLYGLEKGDNCI